MNQKQRDAVVIGLLSMIAVLALVAATRTLPAPPVPQYDGLETTIRKVLEDCEIKNTARDNTISSFGSSNVPPKWQFVCDDY